MHQFIRFTDFQGEKKGFHPKNKPPPALFWRESQSARLLSKSFSEFVNTYSAAFIPMKGRRVTVLLDSVFSDIDDIDKNSYN